jgi:hypothetical protein
VQSFGKAEFKLATIFLPSRDLVHADYCLMEIHLLLGKVKPHGCSSYHQYLLTMQATGFLASPSSRVDLESYPERSIPFERMHMSGTDGLSLIAAQFSPAQRRRAY